MSDFPAAITSPRTIANRAGVEYDPDNTKTLYAEDIQKINAEIVAIETALGTTPKGAYATVKAWLTALSTPPIATIVNPYKFRAYRGGAQTIASNSTVKILFDGENFDVNNNFSVVNSEYTVPVSGYYQINARCLLIDQNRDCKILLYKGASTVLSTGNNTIGNYPGLVLSDMQYLTAGDVLSIKVINTGAATTLETGATNAYFSMHLLSV
jgi:hypothetical protein